MTTGSMPSVGKLLGQAVVFGLFGVGIAYLSTDPAYQYFDGAKAQILVSFAHGGAKGSCRKRTAEELANLAPNMRAKLLCSRERIPLRFEMALDGRVVYAETLTPTGLRSDGPSRTYHKITVDAGRHRLGLKLRDTDRTEGFDYEHDTTVELKPGQNLAVDFKAAQGGFRLE